MFVFNQLNDTMGLGAKCWFNPTHILHNFTISDVSEETIQNMITEEVHLSYTIMKGHIPIKMFCFPKANLGLILGLFIGDISGWGFNAQVQFLVKQN